MDCCIDGDDGPLDLAAMADLVAVIKGAGAEGRFSSTAVLWGKTFLRRRKKLHYSPLQPWGCWS